jgi:hypothetical protein
LSLLLLCLFIVGVVVFLVKTDRLPPSEDGSEPLPSVTSSPQGKVVKSGKILCLPHKEQSDFQTLECAYGMQDEEGIYYALSDTSSSYENISAAPMNTKVIVEGDFSPQQSQIYPSIGIILVSKISTL